MKVELGYILKYPFIISQEQVRVFAELTGDTNPLHLDEQYAKSSIYGQRIIPGFLGGSIFSKVFGAVFPGEGTIYLKQDMKFYKPMIPAVNYFAVFEVVLIDEVKKRITFKTSIVDEKNTSYIIGEAVLQNDRKDLWEK
jgi:3-hydroxybutyryl-CoA dehydratase